MLDHSGKSRNLTSIMVIYCAKSIKLHDCLSQKKRESVILWGSESVSCLFLSIAILELGFGFKFEPIYTEYWADLPRVLLILSFFFLLLNIFFSSSWTVARHLHTIPRLLESFFSYGVSRGELFLLITVITYSNHYELLSLTFFSCIKHYRLDLYIHSFTRWFWGNDKFSKMEKCKMNSMQLWFHHQIQWT